MTGLEAIVAALVAGASAGVAESAGQAVREAYARLRLAVQQRLSRAEGPSIEVLTAEGTEPAVWAARLTEALAAAGVDRDESVVAAARELLAHIDRAGARADVNAVDARNARGVQIGDHNTQTNNFS
ncbi:hypothetical protein ACFWZ2_41405 [Streptomyces sp. NPDC059002]|uniref:hypothetical protein n=1 Tax=Streptomyces sp. NPDC059002 TaxID=3346690 RepID=UPI0036900633